MAMEPRAVAAVPQPYGGDMILYSATQVPHILKIMTALTLGIPEQQMRVIAPAVGGGFGSKLNVYAEELLCVALARKHAVPVRWNEERGENAQATIHGRGQIQNIELAADADGKLTAVRVRLLADMGAYLQLVTPGIPLLGAFLYAGVYDMPGRLRLHVHERVHHHDSHRRVPRCRPSGGHVRHRAGDGHARAARWVSIRSNCAGATSSARSSSRTPRSAAWCTTPAITMRPPQRLSASPTTTACAPVRRPRTSPVQASCSASASAPTSRCVGWRHRASSLR